jgi:hypothetical protein
MADDTGAFFRSGRDASRCVGAADSSASSSSRRDGRVRRKSRHASERHFHRAIDDERKES